MSASEFRATYRLQLAGAFDFAAARALVPYLASLGVSHVYLPPSFQARPGSTHGYDVVDPTSISRELGGSEEFHALVKDAQAAGLGVVLDIVPNHMATDDANKWWSDPELRAKFFDVDPETGKYRRFFDIDHLAGVRQEDAEVFEATHELALQLVRDGVIDGLRVDHPDGLADPAGYFVRLAEGGAQHVWVEKILDPGEPLRDWAVDGTVGYEFLNDVCGLWVDPAGEEPLTEFWNEIAGDSRPFSDWADEAKLEQATRVFSAEVERLAREAGRPVDGLAEALSSLEIYRTYIRGDEVDDDDRFAIDEAAIGGEIRDLLYEGGAFTTRFQQTTPPIMAKGVEDTAFYRYARLLALNDVGGNPGRWNVDVDDFHAANYERAERFPRNLVTTMTHDAKRSHDVRARIAAISSGADEWIELVRGVVRRERAAAGRRAWAGPDRGVLRLPDPRRRLADRCGSGRRVHGEGAARGQAQLELDRRPTSSGRTASSSSSARSVRARAVPRDVPAVCGADRGGRVGGRAAADGAEVHRARRARHLQRRRAGVLRARRPGQPAAGGLGVAAGAARERRRAEAGADQGAAGAAARIHADAFAGSYEADRRGRRHRRVHPRRRGDGRSHRPGRAELRRARRLGAGIGRLARYHSAQAAGPIGCARACGSCCCPGSTRRSSKADLRVTCGSCPNNSFATASRCMY